MAPAHGLGAGRNASGNFGAGGLFAGFVVGFLVMEQGFLALFRLGLCRLGSLGGGVLVVTVKGPASNCGRGNRAERGESESEASCEKEFLHNEHLMKTISSTWCGERLLYRGTVFREGNRTERHGVGREFCRWRGEKIWEHRLKSVLPVWGGLLALLRRAGPVNSFGAQKARLKGQRYREEFGEELEDAA
jgi:hypothetical protein